MDNRLVPEVNPDGPVDDKNTSQMDGVTGKILGLTPVFVLLLIIFVRIVFVLYKNSGQKARSTQQRRPYIGSRSQSSLPPTDPAIYVSPANLPPPPKYEAMAPPSYEEVVGVHYPNFQPSQVQPIAQPIVTAMSQNASSPSVANETPKDTATDSCAPPTVLTVTNERTATTSAS